MADKKDHTGRNVAVGVGAVALIALLLGGGGLGLGGGGGLIPGTGSGGQQGQEAQQVQEAQEPQEEQEAQGEPGVIEVRITEDQVTINGNPAADAEALRAYIEEYNADGVTFRLVEEHSILETYEWVTATFSELKIPLESGEE